MRLRTNISLSCLLSEYDHFRNSISQGCGESVHHQQVDKNLEPGKEKFNQKHYLKCEYCLWSTSYVDASGYLDISGTKVQCPSCNNGIVEVISTSYNKDETDLSPSCLRFVLTDW